MKISELVKKTGVPKETIHFYIREGLLRKPRKGGVNIADYHEGYVEQIQLIKDLRDNYYLPIPEIKKIIKNFKKVKNPKQMAKHAGFPFMLNARPKKLKIKNRTELAKNWKIIWTEKMKKETYFSAEMAKEWGLVDEIK